jgi:hypothetical protein
VVIEDPNGELIGFAKGQPYSHHDHAQLVEHVLTILRCRKHDRIVVPGSSRRDPTVLRPTEV